MQQVIDFLNRSDLQYFSTIGLDNKPKVRPFQMMFSRGGKLIYCTGAGKEVFKELSTNPDVELCTATSDSWLRIRGKVRWFDDKETREEILRKSPLVASIYKSADNPELRTFYLSDATAVIQDFSGEAPRNVRLTEKEK